MGNISAWNAKIDHTYSIIGLNGIHYEYVMPLHSFDSKYYEQAIDVRSKNKKTGRYQPVGDKSYFTFYQLKKLRKHNNTEYTIRVVID